jgi:hypothetical protein
VAAKLVKLASKVEDTRFDGVEDVLVDALADFRAGTISSQGPYQPTGVVVLFVQDDADMYRVRRRCSNMRVSEIVGLLEIAKARELEQSAEPD